MFTDFKVAATSLKRAIRLHAHPVGTNTRSGTEAIFTLILLAHVRSELGYFAHSLISGFNDDAATLTFKMT